MATKTKAHVTIDIDDVRIAGSVESAIEAWARGNDYTASGVIGSSFSTSGPGSGWSREHDADDYALRAMEGGAMHYLDSSDGRLVSDAGDADEGCEGDFIIDGHHRKMSDWSDSSVVRIECPSAEDALDHPEAAAKMAQSVIDYHSPMSDLAAWRKLVEQIKAASDALSDIDSADLSGE